MIVPLGPILEVFGPVSRPLYSIRLLSSADTRSSSSQNQEEPHTTGNGDQKRRPERIGVQ